jgi:hypothetical protein
MHRCRKNQAALGSTQRAAFVNAVLTLKASGVYDTYVQIHRDFMSSAHRGSAFLPWHREYLLRFENDLRAVDSSVTLPYWDWSVDNSPSSSIWDPAFLGGNGSSTTGEVMTGPFAYSTGAWTLNVREPGDSILYLRRRFGVNASGMSLPGDVTYALGRPDYDASPWNDSSTLLSFRNVLEGWAGTSGRMHNGAHVWIGGSMLPSTSPNDPAFFLNHCFIDKLWADWQRSHPAAVYPASGPPVGHRLNDPMPPWNTASDTRTPAAVLDHHALGYYYDNELACRLRKLKFLDDPIKLKFLDEPIKLKIFDEPRTSPGIDWVKTAAFDKIAGADLTEFDPTISEAPFVLATPHHAPTLEGTEATTALAAAFERRLSVLGQAWAMGKLTPDEEKYLEELRHEYAQFERRVAKEAAQTEHSAGKKRRRRRPKRRV